MSDDGMIVSQSISNELSMFLASLDDGRESSDAISDSKRCVAASPDTEISTSIAVSSLLSGLERFIVDMVYNSTLWSIDHYGSSGSARIMEWLLKADPTMRQVLRRPTSKALVASITISVLLPSLIFLRRCSSYIPGTYQIGWLLIFISVSPFLYSFWLAHNLYNVWRACLKFKYHFSNTMTFARRINLISMGVRTASTSLPPYTRAEAHWEQCGPDMAAFGSLKKVKHTIACSILRISNCIFHEDIRGDCVDCYDISSSDAITRHVDSLVHDSVPRDIIRSMRVLLERKGSAVNLLYRGFSLLIQVNTLKNELENEVSLLFKSPKWNENEPSLVRNLSESTDNLFLLDELPRMIDLISRIRSAHEWMATESWLYQQSLTSALRDLQHADSANSSITEHTLLKVLRLLKGTDAAGDVIHESGTASKSSRSQRLNIALVSEHWQSLETRLIRATLLWLERNSATSSEAKELLALLPEQDHHSDTATVDDIVSPNSALNTYRESATKGEYSIEPEERSIINKKKLEQDPNVMIVDVFSGVVTGSDTVGTSNRNNDIDFFSDPLKARSLLNELAIHMKALRSGVCVMERENGSEPVPVQLFQPIEALKQEVASTSAPAVNKGAFSNKKDDRSKMSKLNEDFMTALSLSNRAQATSYMLGSSSDSD